MDGELIENDENRVILPRFFGDNFSWVSSPSLTCGSVCGTSKSLFLPVKLEDCRTLSIPLTNLFLQVPVFASSQSSMYTFTGTPSSSSTFIELHEKIDDIDKEDEIPPEACFSVELADPRLRPGSEVVGVPLGRTPTPAGSGSSPPHLSALLNT